MSCERLASLIRIISMNEYSQPPAGKITVHGNGFGAATPEQIEKRAREIALIDERDPENYTDADWDAARRELLGLSPHTPPEENKDTETLEEEWQLTASDRGHRVPRPGLDEEENLGEQLVAG